MNNTIIYTNSLVLSGAVDVNNAYAAFAALSNPCCPLVSHIEYSLLVWPTIGKLIQKTGSR